MFAEGRIPINENKNKDITKDEGMTRKVRETRVSGIRNQIN
jgi:hypothetical protein